MKGQLLDRTQRAAKPGAAGLESFVAEREQTHANDRRASQPRGCAAVLAGTDHES